MKLGAGADSTVNDGAIIVFVMVVLAALALYLAPTIVAAIRRVPNVASVAAINVLLGWSLFGWAVSWALALRSRPQLARPRAVAPPPPGWYSDPWRSTGVRFWTGAAWSDARWDRPGPSSV